MSNIVKKESLDFFNVEQYETLQKVSRGFAYSDLVPDMYKAKSKEEEPKAIANCIIAIDIANRIDANVLMVMQNLVIVSGKPSWSAKFLIGTINTCGRFEPLQYKFTNKGKLGKVKYTDYEWVPKQNGPGNVRQAVTKEFDGSQIDNIECVAFTSQKGSKDVLESSPISIEMAVKEGWYMKTGSKWQTMPKQMLMYRAASFWTSSYAPEISMGMRTEEEVRDIEDADYIDVTDKFQKEINKTGSKTINIDNIVKEELVQEPVAEDDKPTSPDPVEPARKTPAF